MITRVVKMHFQAQYVNEFVKVYQHIVFDIKNVNGCVSLQLLRDENNDSVFFTLSTWKSESHLELYRSSELFRNTWSRIRIWFEYKPQAWTLKAIG